MKVVCNSTVLIALSRIGYLWILRKLFGEVAIPNVVLKPLFDALKLSGFHIGKEYDEILKLAGEI